MRYLIPAASVDRPISITIEIDKSRFIAWVASIETIEDAQSLVSLAQARYPDASHYSFAFIAGPPGEDQRIGFSDDGEPSGTAGRPIHLVLASSGLGRIACVVTRYFGGIKLGTGGLSRAYAQAASTALSETPTRMHIARRRLSIDLDFADEQAARAWLEANEGVVEHADYHGQGVTLVVAWPTDSDSELDGLVARLAGRVTIRDG